MAEINGVIKTKMHVDTRYRSYAVIYLGEAIIPVKLKGDWIIDCFPTQFGDIVTYPTVEEAWKFIAEDYAETHKEFQGQ